MNNKNSLILPVAIGGIIFLLGIIILAMTWKSNYNSSQTITVTGSATKEIISDLAILKGTITTQSASAEAAYRELESEKPVLLQFLASKGFPKEKVELSAITHFPIYETAANGYQTQNIKGYTYNQQVEIQSTDVNKIKQLSIDVASVVEKGVNFNVNPPEYHYTNLAQLKINMQAEAAKDAMIRADKIALATGRKLGPMRSARMGVLQITPKYSNQVSDYGVNDISSIDKEITAVVNASFEIE